LSRSLSDKFESKWFEPQENFGVHEGTRVNGQKFHDVLSFPTSSIEDDQCVRKLNWKNP
jgi:hypothetical protein